MHPRKPLLVDGVRVSWHPPSTLQIELPTASTVHCDDVPRQLCSLARSLDGTATVAQVKQRTSLPPAWVDWLVSTLVTHGAVRDAPTPAQVQVHGGGALATSIIKLLLDDPFLSVWVSQPLWPARDALASVEIQDLLCSHAHGTEGEQRMWAVPLDSDDFSPAPTIAILATGYVEPDRATTDALCRADIPHLVTSFVGSRLTVGPFVVPGQTACLRCTDLSIASQEPLWPQRLAQRSRTPADLSPTAISWVSSTVAYAVRGWLAFRESDSLGLSLEMDINDGLLRTRRSVLHPDCGCASC